MKLNEKLSYLRLKLGLSQQETAEQLGISLETLNNWENNTAIPDASNICKLSNFFNVTTDYLLKDEYDIKTNNKKKSLYQIMIIIIVIEAIDLILQYITIEVLQNELFGFLSYIPFIACIGIFEYIYHRHTLQRNKNDSKYRQNFYKISCWLGLYFPIKILVGICLNLYPRPINSLVLNSIIFFLYISISITITLIVGKHAANKKS